MKKENLSLNNFRKCLLKVGDEVMLISGADKRKTGKIIDFDRKRGKIKISGMRMLTHFQKKTKESEGGIFKKEGWMDISNVMFFEDGKTTRLKRIDGKRVSVNTGKEV